MGLGGLAAAGMLGGGAFQAAGAMQAADATSAAAKFNMEALRQRGEFAQQDLLREGNRAQSQNRVTAAKSGVRMTGSPLEVAAYNAAQVAETSRRQIHSQNTELALLRSRASSAEVAGRISAAGAILGASGQAAGVMTT